MEEAAADEGIESMLHAADHVLGAVGETLWQVPSDRLATVAGLLGQPAARAEAALVAVTAEAETRGVIALSQAKNTRAWVADAAWHTKNVNAGSIAKAATLTRVPEYARLRDWIGTADIPVSVATVVASEYQRVRTLFDDDDTRQIVLQELLAAGAEHGARYVRTLRKEILARYATNETFEEEHDKCARRINMTGGACCGDTWHYELSLDDEGRAVLEAALGPLSAPKPGPDGEPDGRSVGLRRGQALIELVRRAVAAGNGVPAQPKAMLTLTMTYADLVAQIDGGTVTGALGYGDLLTPKTIRRIACDAGVIPTVLGSDGEILDQGRAVRLFTPGQEAALRQRDRHCTFHGCTDPANWCDKHHLRHGIDGGTTDLDNAALLCPRHHTIVHRDELAGTLVDNRVVWDLTPGSYQRQPALTPADRLRKLLQSQKIILHPPRRPDPIDESWRTTTMTGWRLPDIAVCYVPDAG